MTDSLKEVVTSLKPDKSSLLPCPFCGGEAHVVWNPYGNNDDVCAVICDCGVFGDYGLSEQQAIEAWNTRVKPPCGGGYCPLCGAKVIE